MAKPLVKPKKINYEIVSKELEEPYTLLDEVRSRWHGELSEARIALAWRLKQKADKDGHLVLGRCVKVTDLQKEFAEWDFIIVLNREVWDSEEFDSKKKLALLDHELCHAAVAEDSDGGERYDERDRPVFRMRKHDIEEFHAIIQRHGCYKRDLEHFANLILEKQRQPLLNPPTPAKERPVAHVN